LSFKKGDIIHILDKDDAGNGEWFTGELDGRMGQFPAQNVTILLRPPKQARSTKAGRRAVLLHADAHTHTHILTFSLNDAYMRTLTSPQTISPLAKPESQSSEGDEIRRRTGSVLRPASTRLERYGQDQISSSR
jgi:hypothetical protein